MPGAQQEKVIPKVIAPLENYLGGDLPEQLLALRNSVASGFKEGPVTKTQLGKSAFIFQAEPKLTEPSPGPYYIV